LQESILEELFQAGNKNSSHTVLVSQASGENQREDSLQRPINLQDSSFNNNTTQNKT